MHFKAIISMYSCWLCDLRCELTFLLRLQIDRRDDHPHGDQ